jgi:hypothetical protein
MENERTRCKRILAAEIDQLLNEALLTTDVHDVVEVLAQAAVEILARADKPDVASTHFLDCLDEAFKSMSLASPPADNGRSG